ncbi:MAG: ABC transporter ATP-binding protein [Rubellimicrobium sp.]|nr:ABC transporter ATP-binding protein [Rubellimicrobium sp.]
MAATALGATGIHKAYGPVRANRGISLAVAPGTIHAIVGENGAGKSTLMRILQGIEQPDSGTVIVDDRPVRLSGPAEALRLGIGMVHQEFMLAPDLTLLENLILGDDPGAGGLRRLGRIDLRAAESEGQALARGIGVDVDWHRRAAAAPVHVQQFTEIIRLLRRGTRVLILDEPTAVLAPGQVAELFATLRRFRDGGGTILFISHKIAEVMALADAVTVIRAGEPAFSARIAATSAQEIAGHIVRGAPPPPPSPRTGTPGAVALRVSDLSAPSVERSHPLRAVSFELRSGEILGLAGVAGNGQTELVEALVGLRAASGTVELDGRRLEALPPAGRRAAGLGYISADRRHEGLAVTASIEANVTAGSHRHPPIARGPFLDLRARATAAADRLSRLTVKYGTLADPASSLSGGNQQRLVFAREIATAPRALVVSQPTRGVDLNGIAAIHSLMRELRDSGHAVLLVSEELDELQELSDRLLVMRAGRIAAEVDPRADRREIGRLMVMEAADA